MNVVKRVGYQALSMFLVALSILGMWEVHVAKTTPPRTAQAEREAKPLPRAKESRVDDYRLCRMNL